MERLIHSEKIKKPFAEDYSDRHVFELSIRGKDFARFYIGPEGQTLSWDGAISFSELDTVARRSLPERFSQGTHEEPTEVRETVVYSKWSEEATQVSLVPATLPALNEDDDDSLPVKEYNLGDPDQDRQYRDDVKKAGELFGFARYDVKGVFNGHAQSYTFTADNPECLSTDDEPELAIQLPRSTKWSPQVLEWVVRHNLHMVDAQFRSRDASELADILAQLEARPESYSP